MSENDKDIERYAELFDDMDCRPPKPMNDYWRGLMDKITGP
jgi:hypothetical protein